MLRLVVLIVGAVALALPGRVTADDRHAPYLPKPTKCVLLPKAQQPKPWHHASGSIVVTIPATTCNTPRR